ncbi:hypothetical protein ACH4VR_00240 [Streptomyces sp. NPDC020883]|uniref:hypothetical protein n=1 Tax=Streptomyces sp. NPDC020883 TaxID=3365099 RepID=UPI003790A1AD
MPGRSVDLVAEVVGEGRLTGPAGIAARPAQPALRRAVAEAVAGLADRYGATAAARE